MRLQAIAQFAMSGAKWYPARTNHRHSRDPMSLESQGYPNITQGLLDRGYSPQDIQKILGGNLLRAMREAEKATRGL
jgi:hypothetical protein